MNIRYSQLAACCICILIAGIIVIVLGIKPLDIIVECSWYACIGAVAMFLILKGDYESRTY